MEKITEIKDGNVVLARHIPAQVAWTDQLCFFSSDEEYQQVGTWNYSSGKTLLPHAHNEVERVIFWTQEVLYIRSGRIKASIYDANERKVAEIEVCAGDILVLLCGGHGYEILEDKTQVLEVKNGPYMGADVDRRRFQS